MDFSTLINQNDKIILSEAVIRAFGIDYAILLIKILGWQQSNENHERKKYCRHGVYWFPAKGRDLTGDGIGNINYINQPERKIAKLVELGILSEHNEPEKSSVKAHRWVRVNLKAFNAYLTLWNKSETPRYNKKSPHGEFLEQWEAIKEQYLEIYTEETATAEPEPDPETERNKLIGDYIKAWDDGQKAKPADKGNIYSHRGNRKIIGALIDKGVTIDDINRFMQTHAKLTFYVTLFYLNNNILGWKTHIQQTSKATGTKATGLAVVESKPKQVDKEVDDAMDDLMGAFSS